MLKEAQTYKQCHRKKALTTSTEALLIQPLNHSSITQAASAIPEKRGKEEGQRGAKEVWGMFAASRSPEASWLAYVGPNKRERRGRKKTRVDGVMCVVGEGQMVTACGLEEDEIDLIKIE